MANQHNATKGTEAIGPTSSEEDENNLANVPNPVDPAAPSKEVSSKKQSLSDLFTIFCAGAALISDGYQNSLMTMTNVVLKMLYPTKYTSAFSTQVSNALLVGEIIGQIVIGFTCDYLGRKAAIVITTLMIVLGGVLATASSGTTVVGMFWMLTIARGVVGWVDFQAIS